MKNLSDQHTQVIQLVNLLILLGVLFLSILIGIHLGSVMDGLEVLLICGVFWVPVSALYLKLFEVKISGDDVIVSNLLRKHQFKKQDFEDLHSTFFPLIFKISFKKNVLTS